MEDSGEGGVARAAAGLRRDWRVKEVSSCCDTGEMWKICKFCDDSLEGSPLSLCLNKPLSTERTE